MTLAASSASTGAVEPMTQTDTMRTRISLVCVAIISLLLSCQPDARPATAAGATLVINELMSDNDAAWIDEAGEVGDYIEIANISAKAVKLRDYALRGASGRAFEFPDRELAAGGFVVVFADGDEDQGPLHASWKLSSQGERVQLFERATDRVLDEVDLPALGLNETFSRFPSGTGQLEVCRYATPERANGDSCSPPPPLELPDDSVWSRYSWPDAWPNAKGPLVLSELALHPARFIEVLNIGADPIELAAYSLRLHTTGPGMPWPKATEGDELRWPDAVGTLAPGARVVVMVPQAATSSIEVDPAFEGVATLFAGDGSVVDRVDFMRWPQGAVLSRWPESSGRLRFCAKPSEGAANDTASRRRRSRAALVHAGRLRCACGRRDQPRSTRREVHRRHGDGRHGALAVDARLGATLHVHPRKDRPRSSARSLRCPAEPNLLRRLGSLQPARVRGSRDSAVFARHARPLLG
jgi:Lamin Tail Domain